MESDEDEDVIFEGSQLYAHLTSSEYAGPEINYYSSGKVTLPAQDSTPITNGQSWKVNLMSLCSRLGFTPWNHEEEFAQEILHLVMNTALISLEDADFLANMFGDKLSKVTQPPSPNGCFEMVAIGGVALSITLLSASSSRLPWALRIPSLLYIGGNVLQTVYKKINKHQRKKYSRIAEKFQITLTLLHELCLTLTKSIQFVQEMELIDRGFTLPNLITHLSMKTLPNQQSALLCLPLRREVMETVQELAGIMRTLTLRIRDAVPLNSAVDNASHYLACSEQVEPQVETDQQHIITLQTIRAATRQSHQQLSEMLRRLSLSFLVPADRRHLELITELSRDLPARIRPLSHRLRMAYDYYTAWKVSDASDILCGPDESVVVNEGESDERPRGLDLALHSLERHLRATALIIDSVRGTELLAGARVQLSHECKAVATCWELVEMEMEKLSNPTSATAPVQWPTVEPNRPSLHSDHGETLPLYGAWEPDVQDLEILEADLRLSDWSQQIGVDVDDDDEDLVLLKRETREERLARKRELAAQSKRLYSELQVVLKSKAAEWKEREARVMERLGRSMDVPEEPTSADKVEEEEEEEDEDLCGSSSSSSSGKKRNLDDREVGGGLIGRHDAAGIRFDTKIVPSSTFGVQASLAAQVRAMASQRAVQNEDLIGDSDDAESTSSRDS